VGSMGKEAKVPGSEAVQLTLSATKLRKRGLIQPFPHTYSFHAVYLWIGTASYLYISQV
jgi:hypothetical protein